MHKASIQQQPIASPATSAACDLLVFCSTEQGNADKNHLSPKNAKQQPEHKLQDAESHTRQSAPTDVATHSQRFPPLEEITRPNLTTEEAAYYLNRKSQTLRAWACLENGPMKSLRIGGRLAWPTAVVKALVGLP